MSDHHKGRDLPDFRKEIPTNSTFRVVRLLFWLKFLQMVRGFTRDWASALGVFLALAFVLPSSLIMGFGIYSALSVSDGEIRLGILRATFLGIYILWIVFPLLGYVLTESFDLERLVQFPVSSRTIFHAFILTAPLDFFVWFLAPTITGIIVALSQHLGDGIVLSVILAVFVYHTLVLSQALVHLVSGAGRSRRLRESIWVFVSISGFLIYFLAQSCQRLLETGRFDWRSLMHSRLWVLIKMSPPGFAAEAIDRWCGRDFGVAILWMALLVVISVMTLLFSGWVLEEASLGERGHRPARKVPDRSALPSRVSGQVPRPPPSDFCREVESPILSPHRGAPGNLLLYGSLISPGSLPAILAVSVKEFRYFLREPFLKISFLSSSLFPFLMVGYVLVRSRSTDFSGDGSSWVVWMPLLLPFMEANLTMNIFGSDGHASSSLFLFPVPRQHILMGKNLAYIVTLTCMNLLIVGVATTISRDLLLGPLVAVVVFAMTLVFVAVGNVVSILLPYPVAMKGWRTVRHSASRGCSFGLMQMLGTFMGAFLLIPSAGALLVPLIWLDRIWFLVTIPLCLVYSWGVFLLSLRISTHLLESRECEVIASLTADP
ncbi:MAG: hypothetical protein V2G42_05620 [bacterium JZ-2024 1]